jgi:hypothetical protein
MCVDSRAIDLRGTMVAVAALQTDMGVEQLRAAARQRGGVVGVPTEVTALDGGLQN